MVFRTAFLLAYQAGRVSAFAAVLKGWVIRAMVVIPTSGFLRGFVLLIYDVLVVRSVGGAASLAFGSLPGIMNRLYRGVTKVRALLESALGHRDRPGRGLRMPVAIRRTYTCLGVPISAFCCGVGGSGVPIVGRKGRLCVCHSRLSG